MRKSREEAAQTRKRIVTAAAESSARTGSSRPGSTT